jgi:hypothetical protein
MATEQQIEANRRNAQLSTGPVTPEGKAAVARNALKHGLRASRILFVQNRDEMDALREELAAEWQPQTFTEWTLIEQIAIALQKRVCFEELEAEREPAIGNSHFRENLQIIWRRQASLDRAYFRAVDTLIKLRKSAASSRPAKTAGTPAETPANSQADPEPRSESPDLVIPAPALPGTLLNLQHPHPPDR